MNLFERVIESHRNPIKVGPILSWWKENINILVCVEACCTINGWFFCSKYATRRHVKIWVRFILKQSFSMTCLLIQIPWQAVFIMFKRKQRVLLRTTLHRMIKDKLVGNQIEGNHIFKVFIDRRWNDYQSLHILILLFLNYSIKWCK